MGGQRSGIIVIFLRNKVQGTVPRKILRRIEGASIITHCQNPPQRFGDFVGHLHAFVFFVMSPGGQGKRIRFPVKWFGGPLEAVGVGGGLFAFALCLYSSCLYGFAGFVLAVCFVLVVF